MGPLAASSIIAAIISACGPMYGPAPSNGSGGGPPPPTQPSPPPQQVNGPPGGGDPSNDPGFPEPPREDPRPTQGDRPPPPPPKPEPKPEPPPQKDPPRPTGGLSADNQKMLDAHNRNRASHCAPPLTWSPKLEAVAQSWANSLRDQGCKFGHNSTQYGENLAAGTSGTLDGTSVTAMWYDEIKDYDFNKGGFSMQTGHFTQVVWKGTSQIGCAKSTCRGMDIYVCNYDPPGNVDRGYKANVLPKSCQK